MNDAIVATAMFIQTLAPASQTVTAQPDPNLNKPVPVVMTVEGDDKKPKPKADEKGRLSLVFSGVSRHFGQRTFRENGQQRHFNEINPGIGVEYKTGKLGPFDTHVSAGIYKNSVYNVSKYVGGGIETNGSRFVGAGIEGGLLTGYPDMTVPLAAIPFVRLGDTGGVNVKVNVIPPIKNLTPMTVGVQVRVPLGPK